MLLAASSLGEISFPQLMEVYHQTNLNNGKILAPFDSEARQLQLAEENFYDYLHDSFFRHPSAQYMIWAEEGRYTSALRLEPYRDGLLLGALETAPDFRRRGCATRLIRAVQGELTRRGNVQLYSHVHKKNLASLSVHGNCDFQIIQDSAVFLDGTVSAGAFTLCWKSFFEENEKKD